MRTIEFRHFHIDVYDTHKEIIDTINYNFTELMYLIGVGVFNPDSTNNLAYEKMLVFKRNNTSIERATVFYVHDKEKDKRYYHMQSFSDSFRGEFLDYYKKVRDDQYAEENFSTLKQAKHLYKKILSKQPKIIRYKIKEIYFEFNRFMNVSVALEDDDTKKEKFVTFSKDAKKSGQASMASAFGEKYYTSFDVIKKILLDTYRQNIKSAHDELLNAKRKFTTIYNLTDD